MALQAVIKIVELKVLVFDNYSIICLFYELESEILNSSFCDYSFKN